jgi:hypothetical protein
MTRDAARLIRVAVAVAIVAGVTVAMYASEGLGGAVYGLLASAVVFSAVICLVERSESGDR